MTSRRPWRLTIYNYDMVITTDEMDAKSKERGTLLKDGVVRSEVLHDLVHASLGTTTLRQRLSSSESSSTRISSVPLTKKSKDPADIMEQATEFLSCFQYPDGVSTASLESG
jgi:hypothetical protein